MHPMVFKIFASMVGNKFKGGVVLEIGAVPSEASLLNMECLKNAEKIGINLFETGKYSDFEVVRGNANNLTIFPDNHFELVMSNATLEHDKFFWRTLSEMRRVTKINGLLLVGVPGFKRYALIDRLYKIKSMPDAVKYSTPTFIVHDLPEVGDYYRFSEQSMREVILEGFKEKKVKTILMPPRIIGMGVKEKM